MYVLNATDPRLDLDLIHFKKSVQRYLTEDAGIPIIKREGDILFFRKTKALKDAILEAPLWVRVMTREEAKTIE